MAPGDASHQPFLNKLVQAVGAEHVLTDENDRSFYAHDVYRQIAVPMAIIRPGTIDELARVVGMATKSGVAVVPRGGGASYSDGYLPTTENSISIDTSRLDRIEISEENMYVTCECGVTWSALHETLKAKGLRTPFWGPFSGLKATVGGSTSQGSVSFGTGNHGVSADSIIALEVVLADGSLVRTGAWGGANGTPFFRHYGPDLTGLFTGDTGAMAIKARITLRLLKIQPVVMSASFGFQDFESMAEGMKSAAKFGVTADNFGIDPVMQRGWLGNTSTKQSTDAAFAVFKNSRNPLEGIAKLIRMAFAGKRFLDKSKYSAHFIVEGIDNAHARSQLAAIRSVVSTHGDEVPNTIPTVVRATPFMPLTNILGPQGERWVPLHGIMPFSQTHAFHAQLMSLLDRNMADMKRLNIVTAAMFMTVSTHAFLYEPVFYWQDSRTLFHKRFMPQDYLETLPEYEANPEAREFVEQMRNKIREIFLSVGAVHLQVGKSYPYMIGREESSIKLLHDVKTLLDPNGMVNPGSLDL